MANYPGLGKIELWHPGSTHFNWHRPAAASSGLRGAIPLALALGLLADFEHRMLVIDLTLGVVLMSLLIQGTSVSWLLRKLGLIETPVASPANEQG